MRVAGGEEGINKGSRFKSKVRGAGLGGLTALAKQRSSSERVSAPASLSQLSSTTRWQAASFTLCTLMEGKRCWKRVAARRRCSPPPLNPDITTSGGARKAVAGTRGRVCAFSTSRASE